MAIRLPKRWTALALAFLFATAILAFAAGRGGSGEAFAQAAGSDMAQRVDQLQRVLNEKDAGPQAHAKAIDSFFDIIWANMRILPTRGPANAQTQALDEAVREVEMRMAQELERFIQKSKEPAVKDRALDVKLLLEEANEVARAVGQFTDQCGEGDDLNVPPCDQLRPLLDEETGTEMPAGAGGVIGPGFEAKVRGPFVPSWATSRTWDEDVQVTEPIAPGECAVIFKETRGLMLRLRFTTITIVRDPWVSAFGVPRGTAVPVWTLDWVPSEYGKEWNICNDAGSIVKTVTKRVVQDVPLQYFWRYYDAN